MKREGVTRREGAREEGRNRLFVLCNRNEMRVRVSLF